MPTAPETVLDLSRLNLSPGEGRRLELPVELAPFELGGQTYIADPAAPTVRLEASRHSSGFAFKLNFPVHIEGPCMRCLEPAALDLDVEAREVDQTTPATPTSAAPTSTRTSSTSAAGPTTPSCSPSPPRSSAAPTASASAPTAASP